jgi:hypothetical protein
MEATMNKQAKSSDKPRIKTSTKATIREAAPCSSIVY